MELEETDGPERVITMSKLVEKEKEGALPGTGSQF